MTYDDVAMLQEIERRGTFRDFPRVRPFLPPAASALRMEAIAAVDAVLERATARDVLRMEGGRHLLANLHSYGSAAKRLEAEGVAHLPYALQRLAVFHIAGLVREAAVRALATRSEDDAVSYLLIRMNDWVTEVAYVAREALRQRLDATHATAWVKALPILLRLRWAHRHVVNDVQEKALAIVTSPAGRAALLEGLRAGTPDVQHACIEMVLTLPREEVTPALMEAARGRDPVIAAHAAAFLLAATDPRARHEAVASLRESRWPSIRGRALASLWSDPSSAGDLARATLFDPATPIREAAQFELRKRGETNIAQTYRDALADARGPKLVVVIDALADCGAKEDAARLVSFTRDPSARVRAAAFRALAKLDVDAHGALLTTALRDPSNRVRGVAYAALRTRAHLADRGILEALVAERGPTARSAFVLLARGDHWDAMLLSLRSLLVPELAASARGTIERLLRRQVYSLPSDRAALAAALARALPMLPEYGADRLEHALRLRAP